MSWLIEFLIFLESPKSSKEILDEFGNETGADLLEIVRKEGFISFQNDKYVTNSRGRKLLQKQKNNPAQKNNKGNMVVHINKPEGNVVVGRDAFSSNQNYSKKAVPKKDPFFIKDLSAWLIEKLGLGLSKWILGLLFLGSGGGTFYSVVKSLPLDSTPSIKLSIILALILFVIFFYALITFLFILVNSKFGECPKCRRMFQYKEIGDGEVVNESPNGLLKVKRTYKCKCGEDTCESIRWENPKSYNNNFFH